MKLQRNMIALIDRLDIRSRDRIESSHWVGGYQVTNEGALWSQVTSISPVIGSWMQLDSTVLFGGNFKLSGM